MGKYWESIWNYLELFGINGNYGNFRKQGDFIGNLTKLMEILYYAHPNYHKDQCENLFRLLNTVEGEDDRE